MSAGISPSARGGQGDGLVDDVPVDALTGQQLDRQTVGVVEQRQQQMVRGDLVVACLLRLVLCDDDDIARAWGEPSEAGAGIERGRFEVGRFRHEPFLRGLLGDAHALADIGPRRPGLARLVDEMTDQMVGDLAEGLGRQHRIGELFEWFGVHLFDDVDEVVEANGVGDLGRFGHIVNSRLTICDRQPAVDELG